MVFYFEIRRSRSETAQVYFHMLYFFLTLRLKLILTEIGVDFSQVSAIRADMKQDDDLTRIVDTTISTFGQIDILVRYFDILTRNISTLFLSSVIAKGVI